MILIVFLIIFLNLVVAHKYCRLVENEGGLVLLQTLIDSATTLERIKVLARSVFENHKNELKLWQRFTMAMDIKSLLAITSIYLAPVNPGRVIRRPKEIYLIRFI